MGEGHGPGGGDGVLRGWCERHVPVSASGPFLSFVSSRYQRRFSSRTHPSLPPLASFPSPPGRSPLPPRPTSPPLRHRRSSRSGPFPLSLPRQLAQERSRRFSSSPSRRDQEDQEISSSLRQNLPSSSTARSSQDLGRYRRVRGEDAGEKEEGVDRVGGEVLEFEEGGEEGSSVVEEVAFGGECFRRRPGERGDPERSEHGLLT